MYTLPEVKATKEFIKTKSGIVSLRQKKIIKESDESMDKDSNIININRELNTEVSEEWKNFIIYKTCDEHICDYQLDQEFTKCEDCNEYFRNEDVNFDNQCEDCALNSEDDNEEAA